jgi:hypothetical protein
MMKIASTSADSQQIKKAMQVYNADLQRWLPAGDKTPSALERDSTTRRMKVRPRKSSENDGYFMNARDTLHVSKNISVFHSMEYNKQENHSSCSPKHSASIEKHP